MSTINTGLEIDGRYVVQGLLGTGGLAQVYLVEHKELHSKHALKVLSITGSDHDERLLTEGRAQGSLRHRNIVAVTDSVRVQGLPALVMELVEGPDLHVWLRRHTPTIDQVDAIARGLLTGVAAAHAAGIVHRDLKPANVLISPEVGELVPRVADFGLAKVVGNANRNQTRTGTTFGTPAYMAPEQIADSSGVDARADVFSLGAILYELISGKQAFDADNVFSTFKRIETGDVVPLSELAPHAPARMLAAVAAALAISPDDRPQDAGALLIAWIDGAEPLPPGTWSDDDVEQARELASNITPVDDGERSDSTFGLEPAPRTAMPSLQGDPAPAASLDPDRSLAERPPRSASSLDSRPNSTTIRRRRLPFVGMLVLLIAAAITSLVVLAPVDETPAAEAEPVAPPPAPPTFGAATVEGLREALAADPPPAAPGPLHESLSSLLLREGDLEGALAEGRLAKTALGSLNAGTAALLTRKTDEAKQLFSEARDATGPAGDQARELLGLLSLSSNDAHLLAEATAQRHRGDVRMSCQLAEAPVLHWPEQAGDRPQLIVTWAGRCAADTPDVADRWLLAAFPELKADELVSTARSTSEMVMAGYGDAAVKKMALLEGSPAFNAFRTAAANATNDPILRRQLFALQSSAAPDPSSNEDGDQGPATPAD